MKTKLLIVMIGIVTLFVASIQASFPVKRVMTTETVSSETNSNSINNTVVNNKPSNAVALAPASQKSGKSQLVALLLVLFVGVLGIHRFYLGYTWQGIVQLLTLGGCGIWSLIDLIRIITGDLKPKAGSYSKTL